MNEEVTTVDAVKLSSGRFFAVGTMFFDSNEREPTRGRIIVFAVYDHESQTRVSSYVAAETHVNGCVFAVSCMQGKIVAAVNSGVCFLFMTLGES